MDETAPRESRSSITSWILGVNGKSPLLLEVSASQWNNLVYIASVGKKYPEPSHLGKPDRTCRPSTFWLMRYLRYPALWSPSRAMWVRLGRASSKVVSKWGVSPFSSMVHTPLGPLKENTLSRWPQKLSIVEICEWKGPPHCTLKKSACWCHNATILSQQCDQYFCLTPCKYFYNIAHRRIHHVNPHNATILHLKFDSPPLSRCLF